jgi:hypothetical protein
MAGQPAGPDPYDGADPRNHLARFVDAADGLVRGPSVLAMMASAAAIAASSEPLSRRHSRLLRAEGVLVAGTSSDDFNRDKHTA